MIVMCSDLQGPRGKGHSFFTVSRCHGAVIFDVFEPMPCNWQLARDNEIFLFSVCKYQISPKLMALSLSGVEHTSLKVIFKYLCFFDKFAAIFQNLTLILL